MNATRAQYSSVQKFVVLFDVQRSALSISYAIRTLARARALSLTAVLTLGIGIGAVTAMFSVVDAVLIRSVPYPRSSQLVVMWQRDVKDPSRIGEVSHYTYRLWRNRSRSFSDIAAFGSVNWSFDFTGLGERRAVPYAAVSWSFFRTLGVTPLMGRDFAPEDDRPHVSRVVVVSYGFWQADLGGARDIVGRSLVLNGTPRTIVGVMPPTFDFPRGASMWAPLVPDLAPIRVGEFDALETPGFGILYVVGRLRDGATAASATGEIETIDRGNAAEPGVANADIPRPLLTPIRDFVSENAGPALVALAAMCVTILLIACMNVSSLLLMRVSSSRRLFAIRTALGATRARIVREELAVATLLGAAGALAGLAIAWIVVRVLQVLAPPAVPLLGTIRINPRVMGCAVAACIVTVAASGVIPALKAAKTSNDILMGRHTATLSTTRLRNMLVSLQVASALVLVLLAALAIQSAHNISRIDLGFEPDDLVTLNASVVDVTETVQRQFSRDLLTAIRALPGVTSAAAVSLRPLQHGPIGNDMSFLVEGQRPFPARDSEKNPIVVQEAITPHYFRTMGTPLIAGRDFDEHDRAAGMPVVIVSEKLARTLWPGQNPIGRRVQLADEGVDANGMPRWSTVVGVVGDIRYRGMTDQRQDLYVPYLQASGPVSEVMIRTTGRVPSFMEDVRAAARSRHPRAHVDGFDTMTAVVARATAFWTFNRWLFSVLGLTGLMLAAAGLYGLLAYLVSEKRRELGVRLALGAAPRHLARGVMAQALRLTTAGLGVGITAAFLLARFVENVVYEVRPLDVTLVAVVCTILLAVAAAASYVPARRATMVNPAETLNFER